MDHGSPSMTILPSANEVCDGYVITDVCLSRGDVQAQGVGVQAQAQVGGSRPRAGGCPGPCPGGCMPAFTEAAPTPRRRPLLRMVRILLECILVFWWYLVTVGLPWSHITGIVSLHIRSMWKTICDAWACWSGWNFGPNSTEYPYSEEYPPPLPPPPQNLNLGRSWHFKTFQFQNIWYQWETMCGKLPHVGTLSSPDNYSFHGCDQVLGCTWRWMIIMDLNWWVMVHGNCYITITFIYINPSLICWHVFSFTLEVEFEFTTWAWVQATASTVMGGGISIYISMFIFTFYLYLREYGVTMGSSFQ